MLTAAPFRDEVPQHLTSVIDQLKTWIRERDYAGHDPYDLLSSPFLVGPWLRRQPFASVLIQTGKRIGGTRLRKWLRVPQSKNPKALGLVLASYVDLARCGHDTFAHARDIQRTLASLRSPQESEYCWGYDFEYVSMRGLRMPAYSPNVIATHFVASALLDYAEQFDEPEAAAMARSAARFVVTRLNRSVDTPTELCFSYTPYDRKRIYNASALAAAFLVRSAGAGERVEYHAIAARAMTHLANQQLANGSWYYGASRLQRWCDSFHTGYNLDALLAYRAATNDRQFDIVLDRGYRHYRDQFFAADGTPKYYADHTYPVDIHSCSQAILTFCGFADYDPSARDRALAVMRWTLANMRRSDGSFFFQRHRYWIDRTPYMRWGQAWMLHALSRLQVRLAT